MIQQYDTYVWFHVQNAITPLEPTGPHPDHSRLFQLSCLILMAKNTWWFVTTVQRCVWWESTQQAKLKVQIQLHSPKNNSQNTEYLRSYALIMAPYSSAKFQTFCNNWRLTTALQAHCFPTLALWSDLNSTHLNCLRKLPHQIVEYLVWCRSEIEVFWHCLCHLWVSWRQPPLCWDFNEFSDNVLL